MNVKELIEKLEGFFDDQEVYINEESGLGKVVDISETVFTDGKVIVVIE